MVKITVSSHLEDNVVLFPEQLLNQRIQRFFHRYRIVQDSMSKELAVNGLISASTSC